MKANKNAYARITRFTKVKFESYESTQYIASHHLVDGFFLPIYLCFALSFPLVFYCVHFNHSNFIRFNHFKIFLLRQRNIRVGCRVLAHFIQPLLLLRLENMHDFSISHWISIVTSTLPLALTLSVARNIRRYFPFLPHFFPLMKEEKKYNSANALL